MENLFFSDIELLKKLNKENRFSLFDYLFYLFKSNKIKPDFYFAFSELFWPSFVTHDNFVFLKENFCREKFDGFIKNNKNPEFWINLLLIDPYFDNDEDEQKKAEALSKKLVEIWNIKLNKDFPDLKFKVEYIYDSEEGDCGLTFYQT